MQTIRVLSLDLDWFNFVPRQEKEHFIRNFFLQLKTLCVLPKNIYLMKEHHYLYPWCCKLLKHNKAKQVEIINIDEHHDFYFAEDIKDFSFSQVDCANFFCFMAHEFLLSKYTWICGCDNKQVLGQRSRMISELNRAKSSALRNFQFRVKVRCRDKAMEVLKNKKIDAFAIIKSLDYTHDQDLVFNCINDILKEFLIKIETSNNTYRTKVYKNQSVQNFRRPALASKMKLFSMV